MKIIVKFAHKLTEILKTIVIVFLIIMKIYFKNVKFVIIIAKIV